MLLHVNVKLKFCKELNMINKSFFVLKLITLSCALSLSSYAGDAAIGEKMGRGFNVDELMPALDRLVDAYLALRLHEGEIFAETVKRLGTVPFQEALYVIDQAA